MYPDKLLSTKPVMTHYMSHSRRNYLDRVLLKLQELMNSNFEMSKAHSWYDGLFLNEDCEETLGFVFIACQKFIVGTIGDFSKTELDARLTNEEKKAAMKNAPLFGDVYTKIELINAVANYFKHIDEGELRKETRRILDAYNLLSEEFPINRAFELLTEDFKIESLSSYVYSWSNHMLNSRIIEKP